MKGQAQNFHLNGHIIGFHLQTQKLDLLYKTPSNTLAVKGLIMQKCPSLQQELKYQEFLHPVGKKANTSLREPILKQL